MGKMHRTCRTNLLLIGFSILATSSICRAETLEMVTYYPAGGTAGGDQQVRSIRVGGATGPAPANGVAVIQNSVGIGIPAPADGTAVVPVGALEVRGAAGRLDDRAVFLAGTGGVLNVGIGTNNPQSIFQVGDTLFAVQADQGGSLELGGRAGVANTVAGGMPYLDFHFGTGAAQDFNARIINTANNRLSIFTSADAANAVLTVNGVNTGLAVPTSTLQVVESAGGGGSLASFTRYGNDLIPSTLFLVHGRGTAAAPARPQTDDGLGFIRFQGVNTAAQNYDGATIQAVATTSNWTAISAPAALIFSTTPVGATGSTERMRITDAGNIGVGNAYAPTTAAPGVATGNMDVSDIFLRSTNRWISQSVAINEASGTYVGNGTLTRTIPVPFHPRYVKIWQYHGTPGVVATHIHLYAKWERMPFQAGENAATFSLREDAAATDAMRRTFLNIVAAENGFRVGTSDVNDTDPDRGETNTRTNNYSWMAWGY